MILAMMSRGSLNHTGRQLKRPRPVVFGFALILLTTSPRVLVGLVTQWSSEPLVAGF